MSLLFKEKGTSSDLSTSVLPDRRQFLSCAMSVLATAAISCNGVAESESRRSDEMMQSEGPYIGRSQSPIDIRSSLAREAKLASQVLFNYEQPVTAVSRSAHGLKVTPSADSSLKVDDTLYKLKQFHIHAPSEHLHNGKRYDAEIHFVHEGPNKETLVLGVFVERGQTSKAIDPILSSTPSNCDDSQACRERCCPESLLPDSKTGYRYSGSLTTPPYTEQVEWLLLERPIEMNKAQLDFIRSIVGENARKVQPRNNRMIKHGRIGV